jgi:hypothetical protein
MAKKTVSDEPKVRSGPRAPKGKKPLLVIVDEKIIKAAKIAAIEDNTRVSSVVEELLRGWLKSRRTVKAGVSAT